MSFAQELRNLVADEFINNIKDALREAAKNKQVELTILFGDDTVKGFTLANFGDYGTCTIGKLLNIFSGWAEKEGLTLTPQYDDHGSKHTGWKFSWQ